MDKLRQEILEKVKEYYNKYHKEKTALSQQVKIWLRLQEECMMKRKW